MARLHLRHITLSKWFPANDPIATLVARLCILREDYLLELQGLIKKDFNPFDVRSPVSKPDSLDGNSPSWRRLYFFRSLLRTLNEIRNAVERLFVDSEQKTALASETLELRQAFEVLRDEIRGLSIVIKDLRDRIGGHVWTSQAFADTVKPVSTRPQMPPDLRRSDGCVDECDYRTSRCTRRSRHWR